MTRGVGPSRSHAFPPPDVSPTELLWIQPYDVDDPYEAVRGVGVKAITYPDIRWARRDIKTVNLLGNCLAAQAAKSAGAYDAILIEPSGEVSEGSHTSVFGVKDGRLITSPLGHHILPGVTRSLAVELADELEIVVEERPFPKEELESIDELFLTGTTTEVLGIVQVDGRKIADGAVGPVTQALGSAYRSTVEHWLAEMI